MENSPTIRSRLQNINLLVTGNVPSKKSKNRVINKLFQECVVDKQGLLIRKEFDARILKEVNKIVVPQTYLLSILTLLHVKLLHPTCHQLLSVFSKYFFAPNAGKAAQDTTDECYICTSLKNIPSKLVHMEPSQVPNHPGSHMNVDIIKRTNQKILVCAYMFSGFVTAAIITDETRPSKQP